MKYAQNICDLIGKTPLIRLNDTVSDIPPIVLAKLEFLNPGGSIKDRMASYIISQCEERGILKRGDIIVDNTSGNTGAGAAMVAAALGAAGRFSEAADWQGRVVSEAEKAGLPEAQLERMRADLEAYRQRAGSGS